MKKTGCIRNWSVFADLTLAKDCTYGLAGGVGYVGQDSRGQVRCKGFVEVGRSLSVGLLISSI